MVKKRYAGKEQRRSNPDGPVLIGNRIFELLEKLGGTRQRCELASLWDNWAVAVGPLYSSVRTLGHKDDTLLLAAEDAMESQELSMQAQDILDAVNAYLGRIAFTRIRVIVQKTPPGK